MTAALPVASPWLEAETATEHDSSLFCPRLSIEPEHHCPAATRCSQRNFDCQRVLRPFPDVVLLCGVKGTENELIALLRETHLGTRVFRVYFCSEPPTADAGKVAAFYGDKADGLVCRMQCYPRSVEAEMGKTIPMNVDLRMSGFSVVGSVVKLPADQLREGDHQDRNVPWRSRKKEKRSEKKHKKHKQSKWEAAAGQKAAEAAEAAAAAVAATNGAAGEGTQAEEELGNTVEADLSKLEAEGPPLITLDAAPIAIPRAPGVLFCITMADKD